MMKKHIYLASLLSLLLVTSSCRQEYEPQDSDFAQFGWRYYESGDYLGARDWFQEALKEDSSFADAYKWGHAKFGSRINCCISIVVEFLMEVSEGYHLVQN